MNEYAHTLKDQPEEHWQPLLDHLNGVAKKASQLAKQFSSEDWAWNAGLIHDLGKALPIFQAYLRGSHNNTWDRGRIGHSTAGAILSTILGGYDEGKSLAYLAAGHHTGLPNWLDANNIDNSKATLKYRISQGIKEKEIIKELADKFCKSFREIERPPRFVTQDNYHFWIRMIFSCLVDADFLDTEAFINPQKVLQRKGYDSIAKLHILLMSHLDNLTNNCENTEVNMLRKEILDDCISAAKEETGLFSLTVPTGGGKTLSAMAFALTHALRHDKDRVIYVIPYTSIIEQTADTLRSIFGHDNVLEHHCNIDAKKETVRSRLAAENWDAPIIVTTNVQAFESAYAYRSSRCRKLHNTVNSVMIFDEAQLIPARWLKPCVHAVKEWTTSYNSTIVLATATQPALDGLEPKEIIKNPKKLYSTLNGRVKIVFQKDMDNDVVYWEEIASRMQKEDQALCIVNSRKDCYNLFSLMPKGTFHLSASMCGKHRSEKINEIKNLLKENKTVRVVSTQLVEAGVDIDFPVVFRALAGLDSIAQAAGRCNREGKRNSGTVYVFRSHCHFENEKYDHFWKQKDVTKSLLRQHSEQEMQNPEMFRGYFEGFYRQSNNIGRDWLMRLQSHAPEVPFRTAGSEFKLVDDGGQKQVVIMYGENDWMIEQLKKEGPSRELSRHLQRYIVTVRQKQIDKLLKENVIEYIDEELYPNMLAQSEKIGYDPEVGLRIY